MEAIKSLHALVAPVLSGLVAAGVAVALLVLLRLLLHEPAVARKLRLPANLLLLYLVLVALLLGVQRYLPAARGPLHLAALCVLTLAIILALSFAIFDLFLGRYRQVRLPTIIRDIAVIVIYAVAIIIVLGHNGVDVSSIVTTSAVLTAVIGFALQDLLSNIISGIALEIEQPFKTGDWVMFGEQDGQVLEINWRSTKIKTLHHDIVVIPNSVVTRAALINLSSPTPLHRRKLKIGLGYGTPPGEAKASILRAVHSVVGVLSRPAPYVLLAGYGDSAISYRVHFFIDDLARRQRIEDEVYTRIWYQLRRDGLVIPFPIRDINVREMASEEQREHERVLSDVGTMLGRIPLLGPLSDDERGRLAKRIRRERFTEGERVIEKGQPGDCLYIIARGQLDVVVAGGEVVSQLAAGSYFGEMSLMTGEARSATIIARTECELYVVDKAAFESILAANEPLVEAIVARLASRRDELAESRREQQAVTAKPAAENHASLASRIRRFFNLG